MFSLKYSQSNDSLTSTSTFLSSKRQTMLRKYIVAGPVYVCLPNKIIEFTWLSKDFSFQPCISYVNVTKQWGATVPMQRGFLSVLEKNSSSGKNKKPIGHRLREWTELTDINTGYLESRGIPVVVSFLDWQKNKNHPFCHFGRKFTIHTCFSKYMIVWPRQRNSRLKKKFIPTSQ